MRWDWTGNKYNVTKHWTDSVVSVNDGVVRYQLVVVNDGVVRYQLFSGVQGHVKASNFVPLEHVRDNGHVKVKILVTEGCLECSFPPSFPSAARYSNLFHYFMLSVFNGITCASHLRD